jgi:hypothetical protein
MLEHTKYEEWCVLAAAGQISLEEFAELQTHLRECIHCQGLRQEMQDIHSVWLTQARQQEPEMHDQHVVLRAKILETLREAGAQFSEEVDTGITAPRTPLRLSEVIFRPTPAWAIAAMALIAAFLGFEAGRHNHARQADVQKASLRQVAAPTSRPLDAAVASNNEPKAPALHTSQEALEQKLAVAESERTKALADAQALRQDIAALQSSRDQDASQIAQLKTRSQQDVDANASAQAELRSLKASENEKTADLAATEIQLRELEGKLADQRTAAQREQALAEVSSSSEMRDVIASRNLHIIDVADVTNNGVKKPFGRIFYTERKSLIFYAYDLAGAKGTKTFYAWGHREGDPNTTLALGSLHLDDPEQRRWVFKSNDAKVLSQIDSVYVTLEPTPTAGEKPKGQKILTAFLGTPANHP